MKTKISKEKTKSSIPECPYEIPISTIYNPTNSGPNTVPIVSIYNPNLNQNSRPPEKGKIAQPVNKFCIEKLKAQFHKDHRKKVEFYLTLCFLITLVATGAIIVIMHKSTTRDPLLVHGEFTILNVDYSGNMTNRNSSQFIQISKEICRLLDRSFLMSGLGDSYRSCKITSISPGFNVHVLITYANDPSVTIGQIGLTFIKGLRILHGKTWLGNFIVNVQSIGFMISGEEGVWGDWSAWSECNSMGISTRTRLCLTKTGDKLSSVDRCLLIPGNKSDLDIRKCSFHQPIEKLDLDDKIDTDTKDIVNQMDTKDNARLQMKFKPEVEEHSRSEESISSKISDENTSSTEGVSTTGKSDLTISEQVHRKTRIRNERVN